MTIIKLDRNEGDRKKFVSNKAKRELRFKDIKNKINVTKTKITKEKLHLRGVMPIGTYVSISSEILSVSNIMTEVYHFRLTTER